MSVMVSDGQSTASDATDTMNLPSHAELMRRARWLASLASTERDALEELPLHEVEARYRSWCSLDGALEAGELAA
jgi:hypothetical protein